MTAHPDLVELAGRVAVLDETTVRLDGEELSSPDGQPDVVGWLARELYGRCYVRSLPRSRLVADQGARHELRTALSAANCGTGTWHAGWTIESAEQGTRLVGWRGVRFRAPADRVRPGPPGSPADVVSVRVPQERQNLHPGYYFMVGDASWPIEDGAYADSLRVYWNITSGGAARLVASLSRVLNRAGLPFSAKVRDDPDGHGRADSAVLYLPLPSAQTALPLLSEVLSEVHDTLLEPVPMFSRAVAPGVGVAEDPGDGLSFGEHRTRLAARALLAAGPGRAGDAGAIEAVLVDAFCDQGLDPGRPHLSPGSDATYPELSAPPTRTTVATPHSSAADDLDGDCLGAAVAIGDLLCRDAYWDRGTGRCNWLGRTQDVAELEHGLTPRALATTLGPGLYDGRAGVALFLAELFGVTGDATYAETARAAMTGALDDVQRHWHGGPPVTGLWTGLAGLAWSAEHVAARVGGDGCPGSVVEALVSVDADPVDDQISGASGVVLALLALADAGWPSCLDAAERRGEQLCRRADAPEGLLAGLAHGASGLAIALLALHARTGSPRFLEAGRRLLSYEDDLFDAEEENWPDLRPPVASQRGAPRRRFVVTWCNGSAGIAIARLRALSADTERAGHHAHQARIALRQVEGALAGQIRPDDDASLCHGTAGLVETLMLGSRALDEPRLEQVARGAVAGWLRPGQAWLPLDASFVRANPNLMVGAAGVGLQLLRTYSPERVRSVLAGPSWDVGRTPTIRTDGRSEPPDPRSG